MIDSVNDLVEGRAYRWRPGTRFGGELMLYIGQGFKRGSIVVLLSCGIRSCLAYQEWSGLICERGEDIIIEEDKDAI